MSYHFWLGKEADIDLFVEEFYEGDYEEFNRDMEDAITYE